MVRAGNKIGVWQGLDHGDSGVSQDESVSILHVERNQCHFTMGVTPSSPPLKRLWSQGGERSGRGQTGDREKSKRVYCKIVEAVFLEGEGPIY